MNHAIPKKADAAMDDGRSASSDALGSLDDFTHAVAGRPIAGVAPGLRRLVPMDGNAPGLRRLMRAQQCFQGHPCTGVAVTTRTTSVIGVMGASDSSLLVVHSVDSPEDLGDVCSGCDCAREGCQAPPAAN